MCCWYEWWQYAIFYIRLTTSIVISGRFNSPSVSKFDSSSFIFRLWNNLNSLYYQMVNHYSCIPDMFLLGNEKLNSLRLKLSSKLSSWNSTWLQSTQLVFISCVKMKTLDGERERRRFCYARWTVFSCSIVSFRYQKVLWTEPTSYFKQGILCENTPLGLYIESINSKHLMSLHFFLSGTLCSWEYSPFKLFELDWLMNLLINPFVSRVAAKNRTVTWMIRPDFRYFQDYCNTAFVHFSVNYWTNRTKLIKDSRRIQFSRKWTYVVFVYISILRYFKLKCYLRYLDS